MGNDGSSDAETPPRRAPRRRPRDIPGALSPIARILKRREFAKRKRAFECKQAGLPPDETVSDRAKKRRHNRKKNRARRERLQIGPGRQRVSGSELIRRRDGRTLLGKWMRKTGRLPKDWLPHGEYQLRERKREREQDRQLDQWRDCAPLQGQESPAPREIKTTSTLTLTPRVERKRPTGDLFAASRRTGHELPSGPSGSE